MRQCRIIRLLLLSLPANANGAKRQCPAQLDQFEAEIETLGTGKKKKSRDNADQIEEYTNLLERHRDHVQKLETLLRMLDNDNVNIDQVRKREIK